MINLLVLIHPIRCYDVVDSIGVALWCSDPFPNKDGDGNPYVVECCKGPLCNDHPLTDRSSLLLTGFLFLLIWSVLSLSLHPILY